MKMRKPVITALFSVLAALLFLPVQITAAGSIDPGRDVGLTISYRDGDTPLAGAEFDLYLAARVDGSGLLTAAEPFRQLPVDMDVRNGDAWKALASTLEGYVLRDGILPTDSGRTDEQGLLCFPHQTEHLEQGLYLVLGHRHIQDGRIYDAAPFMVLLPSQEEDAWLYDVTVAPKYDSRPEPDNPQEDRVTRKVLKVWADEGHEKERPVEITVQLLKDGEIWDTVTLDAANNWRYSWEGLDGSSRWSIVEKEPEGYTVTVTREGVTFVVTNTYREDIPDEPVTPPTEPDEPASPPDGSDGPVPPPEQPDVPTLPQTGQLWWPVPLLLAGGLLLIVMGLLRRRGTGHEE